ncbi:transcription factor bHLH18-like [Mercurialis annua]|uniref:transcription factor bHLH18-like n=1 Tax=Mercurialis annua TaxID=3986 RepID=UPI00215F83AC|nr:transcription factor bHLH18-like [Mercurialis annua]
MEISSISGLTEMEMEEPRFIDQWQMNSLDELGLLPLVAHAFGDTMQPNFNLKNSSMDTFSHLSRPTKQLKPNDNLNANLPPNFLSFSNSAPTNHQIKPKEEAHAILSNHMMFSQGNSFENQNYVLKACQGAKRINNGRISQSQDHIMAERRRREKLSQRFIALSAIVPGLKKMDKASVLGDAIKYLKQLQEKVQKLEEQTQKKTMESVIIVKKSQLVFGEEDNNSSSDESFSFEEPLPEIEVRICDKHVLIRIHCENKKGILEKTISEIEKFQLSVINTSVLTFGSCALDVTIIAQMDVEFNMPVKDLVKNLHSALKLFM